MPASEEQLLEDSEALADPQSPLVKRRLTRSGTRVVEAVAKSHTKGTELEDSDSDSDIKTPQARRKVNFFFFRTFLTSKANHEVYL